MESLDDVTNLHMSGARAVFHVKDGETLERQEISDAFADEGMKLETFEKLERPPAAAVYLIDAGVT